MKKKALTTSLIILITVLLVYVVTSPLAAEAAAGLTAGEDDRSAMLGQSQPIADEQKIPAPIHSCADPIPSNVANCQKIEQEILNSTVRLLMYTSIMEVEGICCQIVNSNGHATVKEGRYLVSHNHYGDAAFSLLQLGDPENLLTVNVIDANGEIVLRVPAQTISVLGADRETVVLDFGEQDGRGVFEAAGFSSAEYSETPLAAVQPGMEVAQIDWDGWSSHIDWTTIEAVTTVSETPIVKLSDCIRSGASGGGLFWQGVHIGNNWSRSPSCGPELDPADHSFVALNTRSVIEP